MAEITITVSDDERCSCMGAILQLNEIPHIKSMSVAMIAETANIKETKCRAVLADLLDSKMVERYRVTDNRRLQRYYYTVQAPGRELLEKQSYGDET